MIPKNTMDVIDSLEDVPEKRRLQVATAAIDAYLGYIIMVAQDNGET
jgi:hypothetical protein